MQRKDVQVVRSRVIVPFESRCSKTPTRWGISVPITNYASAFLFYPLIPNTDLATKFKRSTSKTSSSFTVSQPTKTNQVNRADRFQKGKTKHSISSVPVSHLQGRRSWGVWGVYGPPNVRY
jgi:hypothetical protein